MLTSQHSGPPVTLNPQGIGEPKVGVRILLSPDLRCPLLNPEQNRIGREILCRLLQVRLEMAGVPANKVFEGLPLNEAFYLFSTPKLTPAMEAIKGELEKVGLLSSAQIAWLDPREGVWRVWHPQGGRFEMPSDEELAAERSMLAQLIGAVEKGLQSGNEQPGQ